MTSTIAGRSAALRLPSMVGTKGIQGLNSSILCVVVICRRLSFSNNGGSKALRPPRGATPDKPLLIELVHFERQLQLADDGCFVETGGPTSAHMRYNWCDACDVTIGAVGGLTSRFFSVVSTGALAPGRKGYDLMDLTKLARLTAR